VLWWLVVRRCGSLYPGFEYWTDEQVISGVNDLSFLDDVRTSTNRLLGHKHVNFFITATIVFYSVFILLNLSIDPYIEND